MINREKGSGWKEERGWKKVNDRGIKADAGGKGRGM